MRRGGSLQKGKPGFKYGAYKLFVISLVYVIISFIVTIVAMSTRGWLYQKLETGELDKYTNVGLVDYTIETMGAVKSHSSHLIRDLSGEKASDMISASQQTMVYLVFALFPALAYMVFAGLYIRSLGNKRWEIPMLVALAVHFALIVLAVIVYGSLRPRGPTVVFAGFSFLYSYIMMVTNAVFLVPCIIFHGLEIRSRYFVEKKLGWPFRI
eukprot:ANDGO_05043.mRNA.1 hypothetical protein